MTKFHVLAVLSGAATQMTFFILDRGIESSCFAGEWAWRSARVKMRLSFLRRGVWKERSRIVSGGIESFEEVEGNTSMTLSTFCRFEGGAEDIQE